MRERRQMKLSTINQVVEGIIANCEELHRPENGKRIANEAVIYFKTAMICEDRGIEEAMKYFTGTHSEDEYIDFRTAVSVGECS